MDLVWCYAARTERTVTSECFIVGTQHKSAASKSSVFANTFSLLKQTFQEWLQDKAPQLGAALAYYTVFSLAPLILVLLAIVGLIFQNDPAVPGKRLPSR